MSKNYFSPGQIANKENISVQTVRNWIKCNWLQADIVVNGRLIISEETLEEFKQRRKNNASLSRLKVA